MKNILILSFCLNLIACNKEEQITTGTIGANQVTMSINGTTWAGKSISNFVDEKSEQAAVNSVNLISNETMGFVLDDFTGAGSYPVPGDNVTGAIYIRKDKLVFTAGKEITFKVTNVEGSLGTMKIHGTFSGTLKSTTGEVLIISNGKF